MTEKENKNFYLENVKLSGYKSIESLEIDLVEGLNIIIGKNATGKTNFLKFLYNCLSTNFEGIINFSSELNFKKDIIVTYKSYTKVDAKELIVENLLNKAVHSEISVDGILVPDKENTEKDPGLNAPVAKMSRAGLSYKSIFVAHGIPQNYYIADLPFNFSTSINGLPTEIIKLFRDKSTPAFIRNIALDLLVVTPYQEKFELVKVRRDVQNVFKQVSNLKNVLKTYTPIQDVRFSENFNVFVSEDNENLTITNIYLEFKIENDWLPFSSLSDGTRRLFYIISEIYDYSDYTSENLSRKTGISLPDNRLKILLIEEPELGIHPHQFHRLMDFIKDESRSKQIIMTTHSPQALNILDKEELDRVIIAHKTENGTKLKHLNEKQVDKALAYLDGDYLSDYWLYSDLED